MTNGNFKLRIKVSTMTTSIHEDIGSCSAYDYMDHDVHSPTDSSEDSVEVKVSTITLNHKKRKLEEDARTQTAFSRPLKKRMCFKLKADADDVSAGKTPFRPWSPDKNSSLDPVLQSTAQNFAVPFPIKVENNSPIPVKPSVSAFCYFRPPSPLQVAQQIEPVSLVIKREKDDSSSTKSDDLRVPAHPQITKLSTAETERMILKTNEHFPTLQVRPPSSNPESYSPNDKRAEQKREQRNYKNMTRERRIEANARERTRVHTISAAFDTLRRSVPSYSHNQKLSKLSVLRIACSYIMTLSSLVQDDDSQTAEASTSECVDLVSRTIQREGKLRKKKDDND
ncbi:uncharacterized protein LOC109537846 [Dendroctonus ponderosae]|uniref:BHLH domain-containing protein n=1 Tax=Dendroctonus ponderosae TaxID=77166 RepID=A0AAR5PH06_DENPD|nr:uncharacterized protein LOC109537846 [Dendroctonus ponderosae]KAH1016021.1 hypothetical protein HUJ04_007308 [Dendroctonus ponderosae]